MKNITKKLLVLLLVGLALILVWRFSLKYIYETKILKQVVKRLEAESRIAEVVVEDTGYDQRRGTKYTTIKFLEYDATGNPMKPKYFTFSDNIIQFQSLIIRFSDKYVRNAHPFKGKSVYLFWKVFVLDKDHTKEYEITRLNEIPDGYKVEGKKSKFEQNLWHKFWTYALNPKERKRIGIKNVQIEAPGTMFVPGILYTLKIEHDGGLRIDADPIKDILRQNDE